MVYGPEKPEDRLTDEELEVSDALIEYRLDTSLPASVQCRTFVPVKVLYRVYREHVAGRQYREPGVRTLNHLEFGAAIRRIFPLVEDGPDPFFVRRSYHGRAEWGYLGLTGPECILSNATKGRPFAIRPADPNP
jgi:hypothetical protein